MNWYYKVEGGEHGPVSPEVLHRLWEEGTLGQMDPVKDDSAGSEWIPLSHAFPSWFERATAPPPLPTTAGVWRDDESDTQFSCWRAACAAWRRVQIILFRPLEPAKWFAIGFGAWLENLGGNFGVSPLNLNLVERKWAGDRAEEVAKLSEFFRHAQDLWRAYWFLLIPALVVSLVVALALGLVLLWVRCRGEFVFLDSVARNRAAVSLPWKTYAREANSLFLWRLAYGLTCGAFGVALLATTLWSIVIPIVKAGKFQLSLAPQLISVAALWLVFGIAMAYIKRFLHDFVVPIMYHLRLPASSAWGVVLGIIRKKLVRFLLYGIFYLFASVVAALFVAVIVVCTCCIAGCFLAIPYIGAVMLLPITVFFRALSLEYLAQLKQYNVFVARENELAPGSQP